MRFSEGFLHKLFPFHFILDKNLQIRECGKSFEKLFGKETNFTNLFSFVRPGIGITYEFESIRSFSGQLFLLNSKSSQHPLRMKGGFLYSNEESCLLFCGSPWLLNELDLELHNLKIHDFGPIDSQIDVIQVSQSNTELNDELMTLNKSLETQKLFYDDVFENLPADVAVFSPEYKFLFINKNAEKNEEFSKWLIGKSEIDYGESKNKSLELDKKRMDGFHEAVTRKTTTVVEEVTNEGGFDEKAYLRITRPCFKNDELIFLLTYGVEVTDLTKHREELKRKNMELIKLNSELDSFVYSASHNLRSPLLSIKGITDLLLSQSLTPEDSLFFIQSINKTVEKLDGTILDIIDYSRNSHNEIQLSSIDIKELVTQSFSERKFTNINVDFSVECDSNAAFTSDSKRVISVIDNVISNSLKYSDSNKEKQYLKVKIQINDHACVIQLEDNGIGMSEEALANAFIMFYRGTNKVSGSGLGLYIVKEILDKIEGTVKLVSEIGVGTTAIITLKNLKQ